MKKTIIVTTIRFVRYVRVLAISFSALVFASACGNSTALPNSIELITDTGEQQKLFQKLASLINKTAEIEMDDSLAFLVLPVEASCPSCRKKTIDSIIKHQYKLLQNHFIIVTASGGRKTINSYFREQGDELPQSDAKISLDSSSQAYKDDLYKDNPVMYYSFNNKVYKKVSAVPATVRQDLQEFFSGWRTVNNN